MTQRMIHFIYTGWVFWYKFYYNIWNAKNFQKTVFFKVIQLLKTSFIVFWPKTNLKSILFWYFETFQGFIVRFHEFFLIVSLLFCAYEITKMLMCIVLCFKPFLTRYHSRYLYIWKEKLGVIFSLNRKKNLEKDKNNVYIIMYRIKFVISNLFKTTINMNNTQ